MKMGTKIFLALAGMGLYFTAGAFIPVMMLLKAGEDAAQGMAYSGSLWKAAAVIFAVLAVGMILSWCIAQGLKNSIAKPLEDMEKASMQMADGNFKSVISNCADDEVGSLAKNYNAAAGRMKAALAELTVALDQIPRGDFNLSFREKYTGDFAGLKRSVEQLSRMVKDMKTEEAKAGGSLPAAGTFTSRFTASTAAKTASPAAKPGVTAAKSAGAAAKPGVTAAKSAGAAAKTTFPSAVKPATTAAKAVPAAKPSLSVTKTEPVRASASGIGASSKMGNSSSEISKKEFMYGLDKY